MKTALFDHARAHTHVYRLCNTHTHTERKVREARAKEATHRHSLTRTITQRNSTLCRACVSRFQRWLARSVSTKNIVFLISTVVVFILIPIESRIFSPPSSLVFLFFGGRGVERREEGRRGGLNYFGQQL